MCGKVFELFAISTQFMISFGSADRLVQSLGDRQARSCGYQRAVAERARARRRCDVLQDSPRCTFTGAIDISLQSSHYYEKSSS